MARVRSHFGGLAGQVLRGVLSRSTLVTGMTLVSCLFLGARGLDTAGQAHWFPAAAVVLVSFGLAFHAARAAAKHGFEMAATVARTLAVGVATALASALWVAPWMMWGVTLGSRSAILETIGMPSTTAAVLFVFGCLVMTPVLLISAAYSRGALDVVSPAHWGRQFGGRGGDLMTVYTIQTGGLVLVTGLSLPLVMIALHFNATAGLAVAALTVCVAVGYWTTLTGRLCGTIHAIDTDRASGRMEAVHRFDEGLAIAGPALDTDLNRDMPELCAPESPAEPVAQPAAPVEASPQDDTFEENAADEASAEEAEYDVPDEEAPKIDLPEREAAKIRRYAAPKKPVAFDAPPLDDNDRRTPLLDGEARVEEAMKRFRLDPSHTLSKLAELNQKFAPNAHVVQALAVCLHRTGHKEQAFRAARMAFPLCFEHGLVSLAAAMFYELRADLHRFDLKKEDVYAVAGVLHKADELAAAAKAYSLVVHADPEDFGAIKGLVDVADRILQEKNKPEAALKVYMFLLEHCGDTAMTEVARDGIERCRDAVEEGQPVGS